MTLTTSEIKPYYLKTFERHEADKLRVKNGEATHLRFNKELGKMYVTLLQTFKHYKGDKARKGEFFILESWQKKAVYIWAGWEMLSEDGEWIRRFGESFWFLPKKNGKTILGSGIAICDSILRPDEGAEIYAFATQREQAKLAWNGFDELIKKHPIFKNMSSVAYTSITLSADTKTIFEVLSKESDGVEGKSPSFALSDERHLQKDNSVRDNVQTAMIARRQPHLMHITTAGDNISRPCYHDYKYAKKVLDGVLEDDNLFAFIAEAPEKPEGESDDFYFRDDVIRAANPNYGVSVTKHGMSKAINKAKKSQTDLVDFLTKHVNVWRGAGNGFITVQEWDACAVDQIDTSGKKIIGLDLSFSDDFSSKVNIYEHDEYIDIECHSYIPEDNVFDRDRELEAPIYEWVQQGYITATKGKTIDQTYIYEDIADEIDDVNFIGYDPTYAKWIINQVEENLGFENCVLVRQVTFQLTLATNMLRDLVREKKIRHNGDPVMGWHMSNVTTVTDRAGNIAPDRGDRKKKIDLVAALINGLACIATGEPMKDKKTSPYEERGMRSL